MATSRPIRGSAARYTSPMPPAPMRSAISYGPIRSPGDSGIAGVLLSLSNALSRRARSFVQRRLPIQHHHDRGLLRPHRLLDQHPFCIRRERDSSGRNLAQRLRDACAQTMASESRRRPTPSDCRGFLLSGTEAASRLRARPVKIRHATIPSRWLHRLSAHSGQTASRKLRSRPIQSIHTPHTVRPERSMHRPDARCSAGTGSPLVRHRRQPGLRSTGRRLSASALRTAGTFRRETNPAETSGPHSSAKAGRSPTRPPPAHKDWPRRRGSIRRRFASRRATIPDTRCRPDRKSTVFPRPEPDSTRKCPIFRPAHSGMPPAGFRLARSALRDGHFEVALRYPGTSLADRTRQAAFGPLALPHRPACRHRMLRN